MRIAVIDDEKYSRIALVHQIRQFLPYAEVVEAGSGAQAIELLEKQSFDILFLDVHLGDMEGTTIAALARRLRADDYLLKPFDPDRIREALERSTVASAALVSPPPLLHRIAVSSNRSTTLLDIDEITHIETDGVGRGCVIHTTSGKTYNDSTSLGEYEGRLAGQAFYRIHKTCLVQLRYVESIFPWTGSGFALRVHGTDSVLPIGRERVRELRRRLSI